MRFGIAVMYIPHASHVPNRALMPRSGCPVRLRIRHMRLAVAGCLASFKDPSASTPNLTCEASSPGARGMGWTRWLCASTTFRSPPGTPISAPGLTSELEVWWRDAGHRRFLRSLSSFCRRVRFDQHGIELHDPVAERLLLSRYAGETHLKRVSAKLASHPAPSWAPWLHEIPEFRDAGHPGAT